MSKCLRFFVVVFSLSVLAGPPVHAADSAVVTAASGTAVIVRGAEEIPAAPGTPVQKGDLVKTSDGTVDVSMNGRVGARILPASQAGVDETSEDAMRLSIRSGNAILNIGKLPASSSFSVETPTAVASVRGTQFWGRVELGSESPVTTFAVRDGVVEILAKASSKIFKLEKGQALDIPKSVEAPQVRSALADEMQAMTQADSIRVSA